MSDLHKVINEFCQQQRNAFIYLIIYIRAYKQIPPAWRSVQKHQYLYSWERKAWRCTTSCCTGKLFVEWRLNYFICLTVKLHMDESYSNAKHEVTVWWNKFYFIRRFFFSYKTLFYYMRGRESSAKRIIRCKTHCNPLFLTINLRMASLIQSLVWIDSIMHRNCNNWIQPSLVISLSRTSQ